MDDHYTLINFMLAALIEDLKHQKVNVEEELCKIGHNISRALLELLDFKREADVHSLLYKITYTLLDSLFSTARRLEVSKTDASEFYIFEYEPMFSKYVSIPSDITDFCPESINCGIIEYALKASGFVSSVVGYVRPTEKHPDCVVYHIKIQES